MTDIYDPLDPKDARISSFMMLWALLLVPGVLLLSVLLLLFAL